MLWEILVPASNCKEKFSYEHHKKWDEFVRQYSNGLTVLRGAKGSYYKLYIEVALFTRQEYVRYAVVAGSGVEMLRADNTVGYSVKVGAIF